MNIEKFLASKLSNTQYTSALNYFRASGIREVTSGNRDQISEIINRKFVEAHKKILHPLKTVAPIPETPGICPACKRKMKEVSIGDDNRIVFYCLQDSIVLPIKQTV